MRRPSVPLRRRTLLGGLAPALALAQPAAAEAFPARPLRLVVPFAPGGGLDAVGRILAQHLAPGLGQQMVVENRTGAGGAVGTDFMAKAAPDGYTLALLSPGTATIGPVIRPSPYDPLSFGYVSRVVASPLFLICAQDYPPADLAAFIAEQRRRPDATRFGTAGIGTSMHLAGELLKLRLDIQMLHVPYRGVGPALTDLAAGNIDVCFSDASAWPAVQQGQFRLLAVTSPERWAEAPQVPAIAEVVSGYGVTNWYGVASPAGTPEDRRLRLHREIVRVLADPQVVAALRGLGYGPAPLAPEAFAAFVRAEYEVWGQVVRAAHISAG